MTSRLGVLLGDLQGILDPDGRGDLLAPGLPGAHVRKVLSGLTLESSIGDVLAAWFGHRNGVSDRYASARLGEVWMVEVFYPLSLEEALEERQQNLSISAENPPAEDFAPLVWRPEWLPLMADGAGGYLAVDLWGPAAGCVRYASFTDATESIVAASWSDFLATVVAAYRNGTCALDGEGCLATDITEWSALLKKLNPVCAWGDEGLE